jgi:hypothetical protein
MTLRQKFKSEYNTWCEMRSRCNNLKNARYKDYGGRGITVCKRWNNFKTFLLDMGPRLSFKHSIDRMNNDWNYLPMNCRWATHSEQMLNRRPFSEQAKRKMGNNKKGKSLSDEHKQKLSEAHKGIIFSGEHRRNLSEAGRGRPCSEETRRRISKANRGYTHSEEAKRKISEAVKRRYAKIASE